jgi:excisionase family DNA binding protein
MPSRISPKTARKRAAVVTKTPGSDAVVLDKIAAAAFLGISKRTIDAWIANKIIPYNKLPLGAVRFRKEQLLGFLDKHQVAAIDDE